MLTAPLPIATSTTWLDGAAAPGPDAPFRCGACICDAVPCSMYVYCGSPSPVDVVVPRCVICLLLRWLSVSRTSQARSVRLSLGRPSGVARIGFLSGTSACGLGRFRIRSRCRRRRAPCSRVACALACCICGRCTWGTPRSARARRCSGCRGLASWSAFCKGSLCVPRRPVWAVVAVAAGALVARPWLLPIGRTRLWLSGWRSRNPARSRRSCRTGPAVRLRRWVRVCSRLRRGCCVGPRRCARPPLWLCGWPSGCPQLIGLAWPLQLARACVA